MMDETEPLFNCTCYYECAGRTDDTDCPEHGRATGPLIDLPPDRFGVLLPGGAVIDCTEGAWLFNQDAEQRARLIASKVSGRAVRIVTKLEYLKGNG
jgi:hypothetical protein